MRGIDDSILQPNQRRYLDRLLPPRDPILRELEERALEDAVPVVDPEVGVFLEQVTRAIGATRALELGTGYGISGLRIARGLAPGGRLVTVDPDRARQDVVRDAARRAGLEDRIDFRPGKALEVLPNVAGPLDLVFLDAIKEEYAAMLDLALPKIRPGGVVVCDNLLWSGQVADEVVRPGEESSTEALRAFNETFLHHPQLLSLLLPHGDGTGFAVKRSPDEPRSHGSTPSSEESR